MYRNILGDGNMQIIVCFFVLKGFFSSMLIKLGDSELYLFHNWSDYCMHLWIMSLDLSKIYQINLGVDTCEIFTLLFLSRTTTSSKV